MFFNSQELIEPFCFISNSNQLATSFSWPIFTGYLVQLPYVAFIRLNFFYHQENFFSTLTKFPLIFFTNLVFFIPLFFFSWPTTVLFPEGHFIFSLWSSTCPKVSFFDFLTVVKDIPHLILNWKSTFNYYFEQFA